MNNTGVTPGDRVILERIGHDKLTPGQLEARHYQQLVNSVTDYAIFMLDPEGTIMSWNPGAERIHGYQAEEVIGKNFEIFYRNEDRAADIPRLALRAVREEGRYEVERWRVRKDGTLFWAMVIIDPIMDDEGRITGYVKVTRDMTEKHETQSQLEHARDQLFQSQKLEALGQLTGGLAHDFNNLLTTIISGTQLAMRKHEDVDKQTELLNAVLSSAQKGGSLTRQLLAFARRQPLQTQQIDLGKELLQVATLIRHSVSAQVELVTEVSDQLWSFDADAGQLQLALLNLAFNARDAMPNGGTMTIKAANTELHGEPNGLKGAFVCISLSDNGAGIPEEIKDRIFEPFFTTKTFGKGTGLGLSQVYGFALQSKGALTITSKEYEGTTVTLYLPATGDEAVMMGQKNYHRPRVLIVEDDPVVAKIAVALVKEIGYEAIAAASGREALSKLKRDTAFDLVFSDVIMPGGMTGLELAREIRNRLPEIPILLTTGYSETAGDAQDFPILPKPYDCHHLEQMFKVLIRRAEQN